jgi:hypothetical protein
MAEVVAMAPAADDEATGEWALRELVDRHKRDSKRLEDRLGEAEARISTAVKTALTGELSPRLDRIAAELEGQRKDLRAMVMVVGLVVLASIGLAYVGLGGQLRAAGAGIEVTASASDAAAWAPSDAPRAPDRPLASQ